MIHRLKFTNSLKEKFWFVREGEPWPGRLDQRLIAETSPEKEKAKEFELATAAVEQLMRCGDPSGWEVISE